MDWTEKHSQSFDRELKHLKFEPRRARLYRIEVDASKPPQGAYGQWSEPIDLPTDHHVRQWLENHSSLRTSSGISQLPKSLENTFVVLASYRAPLNQYELADDVSWDSQSHVGFSKPCFARLFTDFRLSRSYPHTLSYHTSWYSSSHLETGVGSYTYLSFNLRTSRTFVRDLAMSLRYEACTKTTFVLLQGCDDGDYKDLDLWLELMKDSAGHPLLMVAIFFELQYRRLRDTYDKLKRNYVQHDEDALGEEGTSRSPNKTRVDQAMDLHESLLEVESELVALRARLARFMKSMSFVQNCAPVGMRHYLKLRGGKMTDRLLMLRSEIDILLVKATNVRESVATLIAAMWNLVALSESRISQQISIASKRDGTIMIAIAVGTMLFLPLTAMASIFAMPFLPWNVQEGHTVKGHPLSIYLALSLPLTAVTLLFLIGWIAAIDFEAKTSRLTLKPWIKEFLRRLTKYFGLETTS